jgi:hypothetical protein
LKGYPELLREPEVPPMIARELTAYQRRFLEDAAAVAVIHPADLYPKWVYTQLNFWRDTP